MSTQPPPPRPGGPNPLGQTIRLQRGVVPADLTPPTAPPMSLAGHVPHAPSDVANSLVGANADRTAAAGAAHAASAAGTSGSTWRLLQAHRAKLLVLIPLTLTDVAIDSGLTLSYKFLIDLAILPHDGHMLAVILGCLAAGVAVSSVLALYRDHFYARTLATMMAELRRTAFERLQLLPVSAPIGNSPADLMARMSTDIAGIEVWLGSAVHGMLVPLLGVMLGTCMLFYVLAWQLALVSTLIWPLVLLGPRWIAPRAAEAAYAKKTLESELLAQVDETIGARREVKAFGLERFGRSRFEGVLGRYSTGTVKASFLGFLIERSTVISICALQVLVVAAGATFAYRGGITVGSLVTFLSLYWNLGWSLVVLGRSGPSIVAALSSMRRLDELIDAPQDPPDPPDAKTLGVLRRDIRFSKVTFAYPGREPVLKGVDLSIPQGEFVAVVGPSGSGKSTVLNLISRFHEPIDGSVLFDGVASAAVTMRSLRRQVALVFQDTFLFHMSIRENIRLGRPDATDAEVKIAAQEAEIHATIAALPAGYDTVVGTGGTLLSGGQRQRLAIARALVRQAPILLLDEATSALDPATEAAVNQTLLKAGRGRTTVFVTHRLSGVVSADRILVVQGGTIAEQGSHNALLAKQGLYAELWRKQQGFILSGDGAMAQVTPERLHDIPLLMPLDAAQLAVLAPQFVSMRVNAGQAVITEGESASLFYIVARGTVTVSRVDENGIDREVARLSDGDGFGEMALLNDSPRSATVTTRTDSIFLTLNRAQFLELLRTTPDVRAMVEKIAGERAQPVAASAGSWQSATVVM